MADFGHFAQGVVNQRNTNRELGIQDRAVQVRENQLEFDQRIEQRNVVTETVAKTIEQAVNLIQTSPTREGLSGPIQQMRTSLERVLGQAENAEIGITAQDGLSTFDNAILSAQTRNEVATVEAQATVAGATAQAAAIQNLEPEQQEQVKQALGLAPEFTQEFFGLVGLLEDPNSTPFERAKASERLNFISSRSEPAQFAFTVDGDGNLSFTQGGAPPLPARQTLTGTQLDKIRAQKDVIGRGASLVDSIVNNPAPLGAVGGVRALTENLTGAFADLTGIPVDEFVRQVETLISVTPHDNPETFDISELSAAEGFLMFAYAQALQPVGDRLLASTLETARAATDLTGITSDELVRKRLETVGNFLRSADADFQRRIEQGTGGTATTPTQPMIPERTPATPEETQGLINDLDRVLGGGGG